MSPKLGAEDQREITHPSNSQRRWTPSPIHRFGTRDARINAVLQPKWMPTESNEVADDNDASSIAMAIYLACRLGHHGLALRADFCPTAVSRHPPLHRWVCPDCVWLAGRGLIVRQLKPRLLKRRRRYDWLFPSRGCGGP